MENSHSDGGHTRIAYLYVVRDPKKEPLSSEASAALKVRKLNISEGRVEVFYIPPVPITPKNQGKTIEQIILNETKTLAEKYTEFAVTHEKHDWELPYVLWPVLILGKELLELESSEVEFEVTWDYLNVLRATSEQTDLMINCAAICWSRYRSLSMAIRSMQAHADVLISKLDGNTAQQSTVSETENEQDRRALKVDLMKVDATTSLRWGFEFRLLDAISEAWNLSGLERKAKESEGTIAQLDAELEAKKVGERFSEQTRQTQKLSLYVATFALVQVPLTLLQISERWFKESPDTGWNKPINIFSVIAIVVSAGIWLRMLFAHRKIKRLLDVDS